MSNKKVIFLLMAFIGAGAILQAGTITMAYRSSIGPGGPEGGLGTIKSGESSVTITPTSIVAISDNATTESSGGITWTPSVPMTVTLTFDYQIKNPGSNLVLWKADWFGQTIEYTDGTVKTFSQAFDFYDQISVFVKAKNGSVSISNISVK